MNTYEITATREDGTQFHDTVQQVREAATSAGLRISSETMQRILDAFNSLAETANEIGAALIQMMKSISAWAADVARKLWEAVARSCVPPKWWHLYKHAKKARVRKKYRNRIQRAIFCTLAAEGCGSS